MTGEIVVEQRGRVRCLTIANDAKRNALSTAVLDGLAEQLRAAADDPATHVVLLRGAGKGFSAGFDLTPKAPSGDADQSPVSVWSERERYRRQKTAFEELWGCPLPVVAVLHGFCLAGGTDLALHCDVVVTADDCRIGFPPVRNLGVPPGHLWVYRVGVQEAKYRLLTGDTFNGREAVENGFAFASYPAEVVHDKGLELAQRIARSERESLSSNKYTINRAVDLMGRSALRDVACTEDALVKLSPGAIAFRQDLRELGPAEAFRRRDAPFAE